MPAKTIDSIATEMLSILLLKGNILLLAVQWRGHLRNNAVVITVYGLKNCDTCRKAVKWLEARGVAYKFHDVRADGLSQSQAAAWLKRGTADNLVNRKSTTWRALSDADKARAEGAGAASLLAEHPSLVKRPVIEAGSDLLVGWTEEVQRRLTARG